MLVTAAAPVLGLGQTTNFAVTPSADAFVRSLAPGANYGAAGSLSVSGSAAVNGSGQQNGVFDSLIRFPMADVTANLNGVFGSDGWVVVSLVLTVSEVAAPNNPVFNRGVGAFEVRWIAATNWTEGSGTPSLPATDGVAYQDLQSLLNPGTDVSLGQFTNTGLSGPVSFPLPLTGALVSGVLSGTDLDLYLTAARTSVGLTFNSRNYTQASAWPSLAVEVAARPVPRIGSITQTGAGQVAIRFDTASNWNYVLQAISGLPDGPTQAWSNVFTVPARPAEGQAVFLDATTNRRTFYRLCVTR